MGIEKYIIPTQEEYIFNKAPLYLNLEEWCEKKNQILWITGLSGGGKGYIAKKTAEENLKNGPITIIELDKFENYIWYYGEINQHPELMQKWDPKTIKGDLIIVGYLREHFGDDLSIDVWKENPERYQQDMEDFVRYLIGFARANPDERYIIEGIQIFSDSVFRSVITPKDSLIVIRTSKVFSMAKVMHRDHNTYRNRLHTENDPQGKLDEFVKSLGISMDNNLKYE